MERTDPHSCNPSLEDFFICPSLTLHQRDLSRIGLGLLNTGSSRCLINLRTVGSSLGYFPPLPALPFHSSSDLLRYILHVQHRFFFPFPLLRLWTPGLTCRIPFFVTVFPELMVSSIVINCSRLPLPPIFLLVPIDGLLVKVFEVQKTWFAPYTFCAVFFF